MALAVDTDVFKAAGIDFEASEFTAIIHFRGSW